MHAVSPEIEHAHQAGKRAWIRLPSRQAPQRERGGGGESNLSRPTRKKYTKIYTKKTRHSTKYKYLVPAWRRPERPPSLRQPGLEPHLVGLDVMGHPEYPRPGPPRTLHGAERERVLCSFVVSLSEGRETSGVPFRTRKTCSAMNDSVLAGSTGQVGWSDMKSDMKSEMT